MIENLQLLRGLPVDVYGICKVYPLTLDEIVQLGEDKYNQYLSVLMLDKSSLNTENVSEEELQEINKLTTYEILIMHAHHIVEMRNLITEALSTFFKEKVTYSQNRYFFIGDEKEKRCLSPEIYEDIKYILQKQNYLQDKKEEKEFKPSNDKAKELIEKMKKVKEKLKKQNKEEGLNLSDIISIVSTYSQDINILTVWNLTIYQLYEIYLRLIIWDEYHTQFTLVPHAENPNDFLKSLKHWKTKINDLTNN